MLRDRWSSNDRGARYWTCIPIELQSEIFHEFFRAPTPGQSGERGLGLGLFIVESFARLLNHPVSLHSEPNNGSCLNPRSNGRIASEYFRRALHRPIKASLKMPQ
jgi:signal transduction histidine kinase